MRAEKNIEIRNGKYVLYMFDRYKGTYNTLEEARKQRESIRSTHKKINKRRVASLEGFTERLNQAIWDSNKDISLICKQSQISRTNLCYYGYPFQLAFYREAVKILFDETLPCFIAPVSKSEYPEIKLVHIDDVSLFESLTEIKNSLENGSIVEVWKGNIEPIRCNKPECHYCMATEVLTEPINYKDLIMM